MDKKRIEIIVTSILGLVFILIAANSCRVLKKRSAAAPSARPAAVIQPQAPVAQPKATLAGQNKTGSSVQLQWGEDPFSGKVYLKLTEDKEAEFVVSGIVWDENRPTAIINNKVCETGSRVGGYTVVAIKQDRLVLSDGFQVFEKRIGK